ncbi:hypothetical protein [Nonomuraea sp. NPDC005650]|uniref:hypothetical protein n=1 Tax=Nonomuraea sp. NPDC005650 TaxID=3157045 RepID=UPI0033B9E1A1
MANRKFAHEFGLTLVCTPQRFGRQREFELLPAEQLEGCHIYIVSQQPRLSIAPNSGEFANSIFRAILRVQHAGEFHEHPIRMRIPPEQEGFTLKTEWPHDFMRVFDQQGELYFSAPVALFLRGYNIKGLPGNIFDQEVLYVGQAFGKEGERSAFDRLRSHSTLQRIYSELSPDKEVWLSLCKITDVVLMQTMTPHLEAEIEGEEENLQRIMDLVAWTQSKDFTSREGVALIEAALIRFFQPKYNMIFRNNFPDPAHVSTRECYDLEINALIMEFHGNGSDSRYWTPTVNAEWQHIHLYSLFSAEDRRSLLDMWGPDTEAIQLDGKPASS